MMHSRIMTTYIGMQFYRDTLNEAKNLNCNLFMTKIFVFQYQTYDFLTAFR